MSNVSREVSQIAVYPHQVRVEMVPYITMTHPQMTFHIRRLYPVVPRASTSAESSQSQSILQPSNMQTNNTYAVPNNSTRSIPNTHTTDNVNSSPRDVNTTGHSHNSRSTTRAANSGKGAANHSRDRRRQQSPRDLPGASQHGDTH